MSSGLLGPAEVRALAARLGVRPTKTLGQNFVHDPNTVRRIVRAADLTAADVVVEVGPGLGSLTLALLPAAAAVYAVEIDPVLAGALPGTVAERAPAYVDTLRVITADALRLAPTDLTASATSASPAEPAASASPAAAASPMASVTSASVGSMRAPTALVANLPYNVAVPVVLHLLATLPSLRHGLVMVQKEVADRLTARPGSKAYGIPSVKLAWYASARQAGRVPPSVFWPVPNVESGLVAFERRDPPRADVSREDVFALVDAAFAQRRKTLRAALAGWAGSADAAAAVLTAAGVDPTLRGEALAVEQYAAVAAAAGTGPAHGQRRGRPGQRRGGQGGVWAVGRTEQP